MNVKQMAAQVVAHVDKTSMEIADVMRDGARRRGLLDERQLEIIHDTAYDSARKVLIDYLLGDLKL